jgi:protein arginine N-methyltransferase 5
MVGLASDWIELDSQVEGIRFDSELALRQEIAYATHLHLQTLILPAPRNMEYVTDYARCVADILQTPGFLQLSIRIPISDPNDTYTGMGSKTWDMWNTIRSMCGYNPRLSVTLDLATPLPSSAITQRWHAEPLRFVFLPASAYLSNAKGYPVLSKTCQSFFRGIWKYRPTIILSGTHRGVHAAGGPEAYAS